jgi:hypothetical protein
MREWMLNKGGGCPSRAATYLGVGRTQAKPPPSQYHCRQQLSSDRLEGLKLRVPHWSLGQLRVVSDGDVKQAVFCA